MRLYKLMTQHWAEQLVTNGSVRIGTLFDYGDTEKYGSAIGDEREGYREYFSRSKGTKTLAELNPLESMFFKFGGGLDPTTVKLENNHFIVEAPRPNLYLFSTLSVDSMDAQERINTENARAGRDPYDSCVEITNALRFFSVLTQFLAKNSTAIPVTRGMCTYADHRIDYNAPQAHSTVMPAMVKRVDHAYQKEYRALWRDKGGRDDIQPVSTQLPDLTRYVRIVR